MLLPESEVVFVIPAIVGDFESDEVPDTLGCKVGCELLPTDPESDAPSSSTILFWLRRNNDSVDFVRL